MEIERSIPRREKAVWQENPEWLFESAPEAIFVFDDDLQYLEANPAACRLLRRNKEEIVGCKIGTFSEDGARLAEAIRKTPVGDGVEASHTLILPDGSVRTVEMVTRPNMLPGIHLSFSRDVTDRRLLERELEHHTRLEAAGKLASGIAHDFNNMLTAILSYADLQLQHVESGSAMQRYVLGIQAAAERAAQTTHQLLAFCRRQKMQFAETQVNDVIQQSSELIGRLIGEDIELAFDLDRGIPEVWADAGQLNQVFVNLAVNARDAMPRGGRLLFATSKRGTEEKDKRVSIFVHDTGMGIGADVLPHIFEPFFTTKEQGKGTGLGLATVYGIVKQMKGEILVSSEPGRGTTFEIALPASRAAGAWVEPVTAKAKPNNMEHRPFAE
ncbi:PAS/PAC sensor signal transduction histidine kinase [Candidatus Koribacter versatilis Ellin345]|uniref:histidine kinase n=1 Tax=Koribacter versatilis (strain Ellin345) TaxID=204669 RepID=Q1IR40_KORVE|nr:PAS domain-containing sensor histidine kinase [Candidatus Koribacter versatilis]ABF40660.1 PAS/PAC sensor signal transduction histidine kinase [Candidatus Koribacter versatilis Ellin345]